MKSGAHAASIAGSWFAAPMASNRPAVTQYTTAIPMAMATPASAPPRCPDAANGMASTAITSVIKGKAEFLNYSFDVKVEGKNVCRALDTMLHNNKNTPPFPVLQGPVISLGKDAGSRRCSTCGDEF